MNIVLIGFMGTGKTTVARILAHILNYTLIDTDCEIEARAGMTVSNIFAQYGTDYFRVLETKVLQELTDKQNIVVATGGGAVLRTENVQLLRQTGKLFLLTARPEVIYARILRDRTARPLLKGKPLAAISRLLLEREQAYRCADYIIDTSELEPTMVADRILAMIGELADGEITNQNPNN